MSEQERQVLIDILKLLAGIKRKLEELLDV
jgi:hypothetical protein